MMKEKKNHSCLHLLLLLLLVQLTAAQSDKDSGSIFNEAMTLRLSVFLCAFLFLYIFYAFLRRCIERPDLYNETSDGPVIGSGGQSHWATACRLDPAIIETFPTFIYSEVKGFKIGNGELECAVCLDEFKEDRTLRLLPKCDHIFHRECIDPWFSSHSTCPVCRASLVPPEPEGSAVAVVQIYNSDNELNEQLSHVSISAIEHESRDLQPPDVINSNQISSHNSPASSMDQSPVQMMENGEQYTLRLPEDVRKQIMDGKLNHTTGCG